MRRYAFLLPQIAIIATVVVWSAMASQAAAAPVESAALEAQTGNAQTLVCHLRGNGSFAPLWVNEKALNGHLGHGDGVPGGDYPELPGFEFGSDCQPVKLAVQLTCPCWNTYTDLQLIEFFRSFAQDSTCFVLREDWYETAGVVNFSAGWPIPVAEVIMWYPETDRTQRCNFVGPRRRFVELWPLSESEFEACWSDVLLISQQVCGQ